MMLRTLELEEAPPQAPAALMSVLPAACAASALLWLMLLAGLSALHLF